MSEPAIAPVAAELIARADLSGARRAIADVAIRTPTIPSDELSELAGTRVVLKAECLQRSGSFKLRGALSKVAALGQAALGGLVTASAGNHARALAQAARVRGLACDVYMPRDAAVSKVAAIERLGACAPGGRLGRGGALAGSGSGAADGRGVCAPLRRPRRDRRPGDGGMELHEDVPDLARVVVPVGGGGLASGVGIALRHGGAEVQLVGVQARACAPYARELYGKDSSGVGEPSPGATIADGIAIKRPGTLTLALLRDLLDGVRTVAEDEIADAMVFLAERAKLVAEGAGAVAVAALAGGGLEPVDGTTVAIVSGGNVDGGLLAGLLRRHETAEGRRVRVFTRVPDRPGGLAELLNLVASARANLVTIEHVRDAVALGVRETGVELTLETRGREHTEHVLAALRAAGYEVSSE